MLGFPPAMPAALAMLATPGFPVLLPRVAVAALDINRVRQTDRRFSVCGVFQRHWTDGRMDARTLHTRCLLNAASSNNKQLHMVLCEAGLCSERDVKSKQGSWRR